MARSTLYDYLPALERLMVVELQPAWSTHMRSKSRLVEDDAAAKLLSLAKKMQRTTAGEPAVLAVLTGTGYGYTRKQDGVVVIPIGHVGL